MKISKGWWGVDKESLKKAKDIIISSLENSNINQMDKVELMLNISNFLNEEEYKNNIKTLRKVKEG